MSTRLSRIIDFLNSIAVKVGGSWQLDLKAENENGDRGNFRSVSEWLNAVMNITIDNSGEAQGAFNFSRLSDTQNSYDVSVFFPGTPSDDQIVLSLIATRGFQVDTSDLGFAQAETGPAGSTAYDIEVEGSPVGSVAFGAGATTGTLTWTGDTDVEPGEKLQVVAPSTADTTIADLTISIKGTEI